MAQNGAFWARVHGHKTNYAQMPCTGLQDVMIAFLPIIRREKSSMKNAPYYKYK